MRRLHRKTLYSQDNSLEVRVEQLERRFSGPELEYALQSFSSISNLGPGDDAQLTMDDEEFPLGQYGSALNPATGLNVYGYSVIDDYMQSNTFSKGGFYRITTGVNINIGAPADPVEARLEIVAERWDDTDTFVAAFNPIWQFQGRDNRSNDGTDPLYLRTEALFFNGSIPADQRIRFKAQVFNETAANTFQMSTGYLTLVRYGNAIGSAGGAGT